MATAPDPLSAVLPLPRFLRDLLLRELLRRIVPDAEAYFFNQRQRDRIQTRLRAAITAVQGPLIVVSHSLGSVITYDVLSEAAHAHRDVRLLITLGSPLGYTEIQDKVSQPLQVPGPVGRWTNVADPLDPVALDGQLNNDFRGGLDLVDLRVDNVGAANHAVAATYAPPPCAAPSPQPRAFPDEWTQRSAARFIGIRKWVRHAVALPKSTKHLAMIVSVHGLKTDLPSDRAMAGERSRSSNRRWRPRTCCTTWV